MARCFVTRRDPRPRARPPVEADTTSTSGRTAAADRARSCASTPPSADGAADVSSPTRVDEALLDAAPELRAIANFAVGTDNIDLEAATRARHPGRQHARRADRRDRRHRVRAAARARAPDPEGEREVREGQWVPWEPDRTCSAARSPARRSGSSAAGRIGQAMARRGEGFGMEVLHSSRSAGVPLDELLERRTSSRCTARSRDDTRHLIGARRVRADEADRAT